MRQGFNNVLSVLDLIEKEGCNQERFALLKETILNVRDDIRFNTIHLENTIESLQNRVKELEEELYPQTLNN